jgi:hypothetical protein
MLAVSIPLYICATASTPIASALILKGVSPGTALVFLLAGPATNATSLTVLMGVLGRRATAIYLATIAISTVLFGLAMDQFYLSFGLSPKALVGQAAEVVPVWGQVAGAVMLLGLSIRPVSRTLRKWTAVDVVPSPACKCCAEAGQSMDREAQNEPCCSGSVCTTTSDPCEG